MGLLGEGGNIAITVAAIVFVVFVLGIALWASRYTKVGPNQVLIISGRRKKWLNPDGTYETRGYRILRGGGTFVYPVVEKVDILSLELITLDVQTPEVYTLYGVPVIVDGVAQIKVRGDDISIGTAAEQFLSKGQAEVMNIALQTVEGHLRAVLGTMTVEEIYKNRDAFAQRVQEIAAPDLANMGLQIVSFTIRDIKDNQGYLAALGKPRIAQVKRDAIIGQAEADRDAQIKSAEANQIGQSAKYAAETKIAEADRDYRMKVQEYEASVNRKKAEAELAYEWQKFHTNQEVKKEEVQVEIVEKEKRIDLQEKEIQRKEKELESTIKKPAEAERFRIETLASAEKFKVLTEAQGKADAQKSIGFAGAEITKATGEAEAAAQKAKGFAQAEVIQKQGIAQAEVIQKQGSSEAQVMKQKAEAWGSYNQAAIAQMFIESMPKLASAISQPLDKVEKIVVINSGGDSAGVSKVTKDVTNIIAQLPPAIETLTGVKLEELIKHIPAVKNAQAAAENKPTAKE